MADGDAKSESTQDARWTSPAVHASSSAAEGTARMRTIATMAGRLADETRSSLQHIRSFTHLAKARCEKAGVPVDELRSVLQVVSRTNDIMEKVLSYARRRELRPAEVDIGAQVRTMGPLLASLVGSGVRLSVEVDDEDCVHALIDVRALEHVIVELTQNARAAIGVSGHILVRVGRVDLAEEHSLGDQARIPSGSYVALTVSDDGCGMPVEVAARAFEPFFTTRPVGLGLGLGLSMVYGAVKQSGGYVELKSTLGAGTTVGVWLPAATPAAHGQIDERRPRPVVIIHEDPCLRRVVKASLEHNGHEVVDLSTEASIDLLPQGLREGPVTLLFSTDTFFGPRDIDALLSRFGRDVDAVAIDDGLGDHRYSSPFGDTRLRTLSMPLTPQKVLAAVRGEGAARSAASDGSDLGSASDVRLLSSERGFQGGAVWKVDDGV